MRLSGHYKGKIDGSGRIALPSALRTQLGDVLKGNLWITNTDLCIEVHPEDQWQKRCEENDVLPEMDYDIELFQTFYYDGAHVAKIDSANRILIPPTLREEFGLVRDVMIIGRGKKITIYSATAWKKYYEEAKSRFRELQKNAREKLNAVRNNEIEEIISDAKPSAASGDE
jgi:transcriptional regulator MraZ